MTKSLVIAPRFCGPPGSGNGGYVCGRIAAYVNGPVTVTLRRPPPLATPMAVERDRSALLGPGGEVLAAATAVWLTVPRPVPALAKEGTS